MLKLGDIVFRGSSHTLQHTDGYLRYDSRRQITPNLENSPINVGYQNRFYPPPPSYATETAAIYHRMIHDANQFVYGIYGEVDAYQSLTGGSFTKIIHKGKGDAHYVALMRPGTPDPGGFGYEAAMFTNGGNGFIATLQGQLGFPDSEPNQNNAVGFQALWGDDGVDPGFVPNYGMFYANNSPGHAFMARLNQFANQGVPQIMVTEPSFRIRNAIFGSGATHLYGDAATSGGVNKNSPDLVLRGHFWDGTNSISIERQSLLRTVVSAIGRPQMYHYFGAPGLETLGMISDAYGLDLQAHALTGIGSITSAIGGMTIDFQGGDIINLDDITASVGGGSTFDLQGGVITSTSRITMSNDGYIASISGRIYLDPADGYIVPDIDNSYSLGSPVNRWRQLWVGPNSLHIYQPASAGPERDWRIGIGSDGNLLIRQSADLLATITSSGDIQASNPTGYIIRNVAAGTSTATLVPNRASNLYGIGGSSSDLRLIANGNARLIMDANGNATGLVTWQWGDHAGVGGGSGTTWGLGLDTRIHYNTTQTPNSWVFEVSAESRGLIITEFGDAGTNFAHPLQNNPTLFIQSANAAQTSQWISFAHNQDDGYIQTGRGSIRLSPANNLVKIDGYLSPSTDDAYSLGSPTQRWKELWLGPDSLHMYRPFDPDIGPEREWNMGIHSSGHLRLRQADQTKMAVDLNGTIYVGGDVGTGIQLIRGGSTTFNVFSAAGANMLQISTGTSLLLLQGGAMTYSTTSGWIAQSGGINAWLVQAQDSVQSARVIGSANAANEYAVRIGTKYTAAESGDLATLLQVGLDVDSTSPVGMFEFYGDGRFATKSSTGHAIILRHTGQDGYIQTTLGHISLAPQDGYVNPMTDDAYSLGSPTQRWKELFLGPDSLHIYKPADANGIGRDWRLGIGNAGSFIMKQGNDQAMLITPTSIGSLALGYNATVSNGNFHTAIGSGARASNVNNFNVAIGYNASATGPGDHVVGTIASASGGSSVVMGYSASSAASQTTVIGYLASAGASAGASIAIGYNTPVTGSSSIAIGTGAPSIGASAVAIGVGTGGAGANTTTIGTGIANGSTESIAIGANAGSSANQGITIGNGSSALSSIGNGTGSISIGYTAASDGGSIAIGFQASSNHNQVSRSIAIGYNATTLNFTNALAIGENARPAENNQAQFGTIARPLNTVIYGNYLSLNNNNKSIILRHINNDGYIQTTSGHLILSPADGEVVPSGDGYGFGNPNNRWYDGYFTDTNTRGFVTDVVHIISANSPYTAKQNNYTILANATGGNIAVNLPGAGGANRGRIYNIKKTDASANTVTIQPSGGQTIDGVTPVTLGTQNHSRQIQSDGLNWYIIGGLF